MNLNDFKRTCCEDCSDKCSKTALHFSLYINIIIFNVTRILLVIHTFVHLSVSTDQESYPGTDGQKSTKGLGIVGKLIDGHHRTKIADKQGPDTIAQYEQKAENGRYLKVQVHFKSYIPMIFFINIHIPSAVQKTISLFKPIVFASIIASYSFT